MERASAVAVALRDEADETVSWPFQIGPEDYALDLGVQMAGCLSLPGNSTPADSALMLELPGRAIPEGAKRLAIDPSALPPAAPLDSVRGGAWIRRQEGLVRLQLEHLAAAIATLPVAAPAGCRPIVVAAFPLDCLAGRAVVGWAVQHRAALVLEAAQDRLAEAVLWTRPTIVAAPTAVLREMGRALAAWADRPSWRRRLGRRLRRLTQLWTDGEEGAAPLWEGLGVTAHRLRFEAAARNGDPGVPGRKRLR